MIRFKDYSLIMKYIETEVKPEDGMAALNIAREFSILYVKAVYDKPPANLISRLESLITYVKKTLPESGELLADFIQEIIDRLELNLQ